MSFFVPNFLAIGLGAFCVLPIQVFCAPSGFAQSTGSVAVESVSAQAFDLPADDVESALKRFSAQSGRQIVFPTQLGEGVRTREVQGVFTPEAALARMLAGTPLTAKGDLAGAAFAIVRRPTTTLAPALALNARAVIVIGLTADEAQATRLRHQAETAREGFIARGVPAKAITIVPAAHAERVKRDAVLAALGAGAREPVPETWVLLLGHAALGRDHKPAFQVSGPRLSSADLAAALGALPGRKCVVVGTARSGGFLPELLALPDIEAVAATAATGEINEPRFPQMWVDALATTPAASFKELALEAAARVAALYEHRRLGQGEHAQLIDRDTGKILDAPFTLAP